MEFSILYAIQNLHTDFLDTVILKLTDLIGSYGEIWLIAAAVMLTNRKTRRCAYTMLISYLLVFGIGQLWLKNVIVRGRPCNIDRTIELLVERPTSWGFPSTHTAWAFAAATSVFLHHKKAGFAVLVLAALIAFSRLYLFVHFPTDVLGGIVLGVLAALVAKALVDFIEKKIPDKYKE